MGLVEYANRKAYIFHFLNVKHISSKAKWELSQACFAIVT